MKRISKNIDDVCKIRAKNSGFVKDKAASDIFLRKIMEFKRRRKYHKWIPINPIIMRGRSRQAFDAIVDALEDFRCCLGVRVNTFYKIISEFILIPTGRKYYPLKMIFSNDENQVSEEFITRIVDVLPWIVDLLYKDFNNDSEVKTIVKFKTQLANRKIDVNNINYKSKDWFCVCAIMGMADKKNWSEYELLDRIRKFYMRRMKKVTVEMVLSDLVHCDLDRVNLDNVVKKTKKTSNIDAIKKEPWYDEWKRGIKD